MRNIGEIISSNRKKMKLSQPMLAELLQEEGINLSAKAISKWETNATEPSIATFMTVCKVLNITNIYEAYFGENPSDPLSTLNEIGKEKQTARICRSAELLNARAIDRQSTGRHAAPVLLI